MPMINVLLP